MRVLVDESLPVQLARELPPHDVASVREQGWGGLRNGVLLRAAVDAGFQVLITADRGLQHQQNIREIGIAVIVICVRNRLEDIRPLLAVIRMEIERIRPGNVVEVGLQL